MEPIDLVYTWCDSADEKWSAKREAAARAFGLPLDPSANAACRYAANDELRYALRSAERCVPWVRMVFLVIDDDIAPPSWLRLDHPRLRIVRLREILPAPEKPCFCSDAIEHRLAFIPGLAERFLYSNDDCMFYRPLKPGFFFAKDGYPLFRFGGKRDASKVKSYPTYNRNLAHAERLVRSACGDVSVELAKAFARYPHHCIDAYRKDDVLATYEKYKAEIEPMFDYPFRRDSNVQRLVYAYDAIARGHGHYRLARFHLKDNWPWYKRLRHPRYADSFQFYGEGWRDGPEMLRRWAPGLFCFNDTEVATEEDRVWLRATLSALFPIPSSFEKDDRNVPSV